MGLIKAIFGSYSDRELKKIIPIAKKIDALSPRFEKMSDDELKNMTVEFKQRLQNGETLDDILPEAFATVREADWRVLGKRPFFVQLVGGIVLHQGRIAEMKTGEGKTLVATLPAYLNALTGKGVHIVTVNDYLARRDSEEMGRVYAFLGLSTGLITHDSDPSGKKNAYKCDITYCTNNELGFDYLRDNMALYKEQTVQRGFYFAIVDEVDSILIDEARTPLIISGMGAKSTELYDKADAFVRTLRGYVIKEMDTKSTNEDVKEDYIHDEKAKSVTLTKSGIAKAERFFGVENFADMENSTLNHHVKQALRAHAVMHRDTDYLVTDDGKVLIIDAFTGRVMPGRRFNEGLHQAIEAKEKVNVQNESQTLATITFQNFFRLYNKLSGMTGTALTEENEFRGIYNLDVVEIPTNKPMIRKDHPDLVYKNVRGKYNAIVNQIKACHEKGQPVLVGTVSVDKSEFLSEILKRNGIKHTVLNAKHHEREAEIVAQAGKFGAVTISTNMAGRGTDIMLGGNPEYLAKSEMRKREYPEETIALASGSSLSVSDEVLEARKVYSSLIAKYKEEIRPEAEKVKAAGGLFILGTERHESRRIDNQLRGRSGRQGDEGESRFYLSLEDDLMRLFGSERVLGMVNKLGLDENQEINAKILSNSIESAQKRLEGQNYNRRKTVLDYDDVMNQQRNVIYKQRRDVLDGLDISDTVKEMIDICIDNAVDANLSGSVDTWKTEDFYTSVSGWLCMENEFFGESDKENIRAILHKRAADIYAEKEALFGDNIRELERIILLRNVDHCWMEQLDAMDDIRGGMGLHSYAQRNPLNEYRIVGAEMFDEMINDIRQRTARAILTAVPREQLQRRESVIRNMKMGAPVAAGPVRRAPIKKEQKVGRNDPCPCGSGKKYKNCCLANQENEKQ